jgi:hypothetical protein
MAGAVLSSPHGWFKSSLSGGSDNCVEVQLAGDRVLIRDSKYLRNSANDPATQPVIALPASDWQAFLDAATRAEPRAGFPVIIPGPDGCVSVRDSRGTVLTYTPDEWDAFKAGVVKGEFAARQEIMAA